MSYHLDRRAQAMRTMNMISPEDTTSEDNFPDDLHLFTNTVFDDIDLGQNTDFQAQPVKPTITKAVHDTNAAEIASASSLMGNMPFDMHDGKSCSTLAVFQPSSCCCPKTPASVASVSFIRCYSPLFPIFPRLFDPSPRRSSEGASQRFPPSCPTRQSTPRP
jgi:hypothetical protein